MTLVNFLTGQFVILIESAPAGPFPPPIPAAHLPKRSSGRHRPPDDIALA